MKNRIKKYTSEEFWKKYGINITTPSDEESAENMFIWSQYPEVHAAISNTRDAFNKLIKILDDDEAERVSERYEHLLDALHEASSVILILMKEDVENASKGDTYDEQTE